MSHARLIALVKVVAAPVERIAGILRVSEARALQVQIRAAELVMPYFHARAA